MIPPPLPTFSWVWFMWIPQLLSSLLRHEASHVKPILQVRGLTRQAYPPGKRCPLKKQYSNIFDSSGRIGLCLYPSLFTPAVPCPLPPLCSQALAIHFPQSLYYSLRTVLLSLRESMHRAQVEINKAKLKAQEDGVEFTRE